jgi:hypothetical protein
MVTSTLKMETVRFSETLASISQSTRRPNPEERHQHRHRRENLKSHEWRMFGENPEGKRFLGNEV